MMAVLVPETAKRLQAHAFVQNAELAAIGRVEVIRAAARNMAEEAIRKLLDDCITTETYQGFTGQTLKLDVYVLSPADLHKMLAEARKQGEATHCRERLTAAESALAAIKLRLIDDCDASRDFPANTCGASRHAQMIAESLVSGVPYGMLTDDPAYCGQSILSAVKSLFQARADLAELRKRVEESAQANILPRSHPLSLDWVAMGDADNEGKMDSLAGKRVALVVLGEG